MHIQIKEVEGWRPEQTVFIRAVFELSAQRRFGTVLDVDGIGQLVRNIPRFVTTDGVPQAGLELLIRAAIGEANAVTENISLASVFRIGSLVVQYIVEELDLTVNQLDLRS